jgi:hypothetical protein
MVSLLYAAARGTASKRAVPDEELFQSLDLEMGG